MTLNRFQQIIDHLYRLGPQSKQDLSNLLDLSPSFISRLVGDLVDRKLVTELDTSLYKLSEKSPEDKSQKRKKESISPHPDHGYSVSLHVTAKEVHFHVVRFDMDLSYVVGKKYHLKDIEEFIQFVSTEIEGIQKKEKGKSLLSVGISVSGSVDLLQNEILFSNRLQPLVKANLAIKLSECIHVPVVLCNDANAQAIYERYLGAAKELNHFFILFVNQGVGVGIFTNGNIYAGHHFEAGESGHFVVDPNGRLCKCGNKGCFEAYVGANALLKQLSHLKEEGVTSPFLDELPQMNGENVFERLIYYFKQNDKIAYILSREMAYYIGLLCANFFNLLSPEKVFLTGPLSGLGESFLAMIKRHMQAFAIQSKQTDIQSQISFSRDPIEMGALGAAKLSFDKYLMNI